MILTEHIIKLICEKFKNKTVYIGEDIRSKTPTGFITAIETALKPTTRIEKAFVAIENNVGNFINLIVITDSTNNCAPNIYEYKLINKACNVAMFVKRSRRTYNNPYLEQNLYRLNYNPNLFRLLIQRRPHKDSISVSTLYGKYTDKRLIIVGGGESWQDIDWKRKAKDIMIMIVNYNFELKADFLIYNDKKVGRDMETVKFFDDRKILGFENHKSRITDYTYSFPENGVSVGHTGAAAIQIAEKMGFKKIYLAGFDYKKNADGNDQVYKKLKNDYYKGKRIKRFLDDFDKFKTERTYNLNKDSNLQKLLFLNKDEIYSI